MSNQFRTIAASLLVMLFMAACTSDATKPDETADGAVIDSRQTTDEAAATAGAADYQAQEGTAFAASGMGGWRGKSPDDPTSPLSMRTIYFDFDSIDIRQEYIDTLRAHGQYLAENPQASIVLEGHCDERGTREYNLALGERRALMVKRFMMAEGVAEDQLRDISYGEERPVDPGEGEGAWAQNRRVELVY